jgi:hypothetical protein
VGDLGLWSFNADPAVKISLQLTKQSGGAAFTPQLEVFTPTGDRRVVKQDASAITAEFATEAGGVYTVLVSDATKAGSGGYRLRLSRTALTVAAANVLNSGGTYLGNIALAGQDDQYTFIASAGDSVLLRAGEMTAGSKLSPQLRLFDPTGKLLDTSGTASAAEIEMRVTVSGVFSVSVKDVASAPNAGGYRLSFVKTGSPLAIDPNDEGGALTNGVASLGSIDIGDLDAWTILANAGDSIIVRMGETVPSSALTSQLRLYDPSGAPVNLNATASGAEIYARATLSGTYLVVAGDQSFNWSGTGNYRLTIAKTGSTPVISSSDEGGPLTNGTSYLGTIETGDIDPWTVMANAGDTIVVRIGEVAPSTGLTPQLRIFDPSGAPLDANATVTAAEISTRATNSGAFLVLVGDQSFNWSGSGNYRLSMAKTGSALAISGNDEGGTLTNGTTYLGTIDTGDMDAWVINAKAGESILVRMGETVSKSTLTPQLRLYDPSGAPLDGNATGTAAEVYTRATNSGAFLLIAADQSFNWAGTGNYRLTMIKTGDPLNISSSDEGGPMVNGTTYQGLIDTGDMDAWTFNAKAGENIIVRMGEVNSGSTLTPELRLFDPSGAVLGIAADPAAAEVSVRATNSGPFIVVADDRSFDWAGTGNYRIILAKTGNAIVPTQGEEGGPLNGSGAYDATLEVGGLDAWSFTACAGDNISLNVKELVSGSTLTPWLRLYGRDGTELKNVANAGTDDVSLVAPASGTYTVVIGDRSFGLAGAGTYRLTATGLADELRICVPRSQLATFAPTIIGGVPGSSFTLVTTTNALVSLQQWTPVLTNQFDQFGVFTFPDMLDLQERQRYFDVRTP